MGAKLCLPPLPVRKLAVLGLLTVEKAPMSRFPPDEERWKTGCAGRFGASDMRLLDVVRLWLVVAGGWCRLFCEVDRFMAEAGMGMAEAL